MRYHKVCKECVMNGDCLLQDGDDVDACQEVNEYNTSYEEENDKR